MHSRNVSEQWQDLPSDARSPLWQLIDALITVRTAFGTAVPARLSRVVALMPGLLLAASLVAGLGVLLWSMMQQSTARNVFALAIVVIGYVLYCTAAVHGSRRGPDDKVELHYFSAAAFAVTLTMLAGALYFL